ncbi:MAG: IPT/TIG domain-containing protein, partial [Actinobacteria bacterium]|nr:IPT/TIG domain-containing protein [Actinomycetota bacterium]
GNQMSPRIATDSMGGAYVVWEDYRNDSGSTNIDIYGQRVESGGTRIWGTTGLAVCTATGNQQMPVIAENNAYGATTAWGDYRNSGTTGWDIYGQKISNDAPTVTGISPGRGLNNGTVDCTITGTNFFTPGTHAKLKDASGYIYATNNVIVDSSHMTCRFDLSGKPHGVYDVYVFSGDGQSASKAGIFTIRSAVPVIEGLTPLNAVPGDTVTITGGGFGDAQGTGVSGGAASYVLFGGVAASEYSEWTDTQIKCEVPGQASSGDVTVVTGSGTSNAEDINIAYPTWYLAEGSTNWGFSCYISIENPNDSEVDARITYMTDTGPLDGGTVTLPSESQTTVAPMEILGARDFSTKVECLDAEKTIAVDRTMSWNAQNMPYFEYHSSIGVTGPAKEWYLPEGSSNWGFETWLLIQNPGAVDATCQVTYMIEGEGPQTFEKVVPAGSRSTYNMYDDIGAKDASIRVTSNQDVIPERAMYRNGRRMGHDSIGTTQTNTSYYLAEGTSAWGFTTFVLIQNPNNTQTEVDVTYMTDQGPVPYPGNPVVMQANSRKTIRVNDLLPGKDFSTFIEGDLPVIAERAMYWDNGTGEAGHDSIGMPSPHTAFFLPDGEASEEDYGAETWTLIQNPNDEEVHIAVAYLPAGGGTPVVREDILPANSRRTYNMAEHWGTYGRASIKVTTGFGKKIMVERSMYWANRIAGTDTIGGFSD